MNARKLTCAWWAGQPLWDLVSLYRKTCCCPTCDKLPDLIRCCMPEFVDRLTRMAAGQKACSTSKLPVACLCCRR